eukprot:NODE_4311_length_1906_cov_9.616639.p1 GENE.NODE_4311_length_1906_cov_9.616639~~NODE_4311_length_1906_cov_9.616639.p1  ORF type:complete len:501 (-),score=161.47 NODE_4311_length_1906_cov_9.616639:292-1794(-)
MTDISLVTQRLNNFGMFGSGIVTNSLFSLKLAGAQECRGSGYDAMEPAPPLEPCDLDLGKDSGGEPLAKAQIINILSETARVQGYAQREISTLARRVARDRRTDKKKKRPLSFSEAHKKILELKLPKEPLEEHWLEEPAFQKLLQEYEEDEVVMSAAQMLLHPAGKGNEIRAKSLTIGRIVDIHQFMVTEMQRVLNEFLQLSYETRRQFTGKECETTAELLVSIAVETQLNVHCEDVETAVIMHESDLQNSQDFAQCTEQLARMMQHLLSAGRPRVGKEEFLKILNCIGQTSQLTKAFTKQIYEDYRAKLSDIVELYKRFEDFTDKLPGEGQDLADLTSLELKYAYDAYKDDDEVGRAWEQSGTACSVLVQSLLLGENVKTPALSLVGLEDRRGKKLKASEIVEMQDFMVGELKRLADALAAAISAGCKVTFKPDLMVQMIQAIAHMAVERRHSVTTEEMTIVGFHFAQQLQRNERFMRATEKQQELLVFIPRLCDPKVS